MLSNPCINFHFKDKTVVIRIWMIAYISMISPLWQISTNKYWSISANDFVNTGILVINACISAQIISSFGNTIVYKCKYFYIGIFWIELMILYLQWNCRFGGRSWQGGVTKQMFSVPLILPFSTIWKTDYLLIITFIFDVHVLLQQGCGDIWQVWTWFERSNLYS